MPDQTNAATQSFAHLRDWSIDHEKRSQNYAPTPVSDGQQLVVWSSLQTHSELKKLLSLISTREIWGIGRKNQ
uniref:hypothetical protein n=1 Tax=Escherichia coli TaxID=562 RepID=UPI001F37F12B|nr:hypothetical protein [Escherichia coli]UGK56757.1 hypothetical protein [Escherichia coli]